MDNIDSSMIYIVTVQYLISIMKKHMISEVVSTIKYTKIWHLMNIDKTNYSIFCLLWRFANN